MSTTQTLGWWQERTKAQTTLLVVPKAKNPGAHPIPRFTSVSRGGVRALVESCITDLLVFPDLQSSGPHIHETIEEGLTSKSAVRDFN